MNYEFLKAIETVIENCKVSGSATVKWGKDEYGDPEIWLTAEWEEYDSENDVIVVYFHYTDTGNIAYKKAIKETIIKK